MVGAFLFLAHARRPPFTASARGLERNIGRGKISSPGSHSDSLLEKGIQDIGETKIIE